MGLKDYFHPATKDVAPQKRNSAAVAPQPSSFPGLSPLSSMKVNSTQPRVPLAPNAMEHSSMPQPRSSLNGKVSHMSASGPDYPKSGFRNGPVLQLVDIKTNVMVNWLHYRQQESMWMCGGWDEGVVLKKARDDYVCCPSELSEQSNGFYDSVKRLNVKVGALVALSKRAEI